MSVSIDENAYTWKHLHTFYSRCGNISATKTTDVTRKFALGDPRKVLPRGDS